MACNRIVVVYHLRLFIDLEQCEVVGVNIQRANEHLWALEIVLVFTIVIDLLSPATERVRERRDLAVCIFLVERDAKTELINTGLSVISSAAAISQQLSYSLERSLSNTPHESSTALFTIIESSSPSVCLPRTWPILRRLGRWQYPSSLVELVPVVVSVYVSKTQTRYRLTLSGDHTQLVGLRPPPIV